MVATHGTRDGLAWELAPSLIAYVEEADRLAPGRSTVSDGSIASAAHHSQNPTSDHEVGVRRRVHAADLTDDAASGWDARARLDQIRQRQDPRVKYGIWHTGREMFSSYPAHGVPAWTWRPYNRSGPSEGHLSILSTPEAETDTSPWFPDTTPAPQPEEDDMKLWLLRVDRPVEQAEVWLTDMVTRRHVTSSAHLKDLLFLDSLVGRTMLVPARPDAADPKNPGVSLVHADFLAPIPVVK